MTESMNNSKGNEGFIIEAEKIIKQFTPKETTETRRHGGIVDWQVRLTKDGLVGLLDQLSALHEQDKAKAVEEAKKKIISQAMNIVSSNWSTQEIIFKLKALSHPGEQEK